MEYESMRAFKDGNQLVIVLENAGADMERMIMSMLHGDMTQATHLTPPAPIPKPSFDMTNMQELGPSKPAKFIQENQKSSDMRTVRLEEEQNVKTRIPKPDFDCMNYFGLKQYLEQQERNPKLRNLLVEKYHTESLAFVVNTKGETELRKIAKSII